MNRYFIYLSFNGKNYCGWQIQPNGISVQQCLEAALSTLLREKISVTGAGRTDSGVHAALMVAHFDVEQTIHDLFLTVDKLNRILPADIAVQQIKAVRADAHARFDALSRTYKYYLTDKKDPFNRDFVYKISKQPDFEEMNRAAGILLETTDFTSFSKLHTDVKTNNCRVTHARWEQEDGAWVFTISADRFLRNMVRAIVGTLLEVGRGKLSIAGFREVIGLRDRGKAGTSVPGHALFLTDIVYPEDIYG
ncbi:MAG: tRNA pseudouridine(38-40) synthase TruA [Dysgonamonadaceae bacterium]|jgi:tRNA pseudouridine38-40 synthase|nr:tRNA pseudouridine(38-40) synthase TruA [Dysgonamonadaceae bacterium]